MPRAKTSVADYKKLMLRLPADVLEACHQIAQNNHRSMNAQILHFLTECLAKEQHGSRQSRKH